MLIIRLLSFLLHPPNLNHISANMNAQLATFKAPAVENEPMVSDGIRYLGDIIYPFVLIKIN